MYVPNRDIYINCNSIAEIQSPLEHCKDKRWHQLIYVCGNKCRKPRKDIKKRRLCWEKCDNQYASCVHDCENKYNPQPMPKPIQFPFPIPNPVKIPDPVPVDPVPIKIPWPDPFPI